ncbi:MAG: Gp49 family protein [Stenotrophomonas sp.]|uniref:Gp49 family protein n=1 Tax=Stenotrophomonas sp. TaxID=69392 RepID=UPI003D6CA36B
MNDQTIEQEIQAKGLTAPRITPDDVAAAISGETYTVLPNGRTTVCQLTLSNGFTVEGISAAVSIENFDAEIGNKVARQNAVGKVWELLGFRLRDKLAG